METILIKSKYVLSYSVLLFCKRDNVENNTVVVAEVTIAKIPLTVVIVVLYIPK